MVASDLHGALSNTSGLYFLLLSLWGFWRFFRKQGLDASFRGALVIAEVLVVVQALLGGYLWLAGLRPARTVHILYGLLLPAIIPAAFSYTKGREGRAELLIYASLLLFGVGVVMRAYFTGIYITP